MAKFEMDGVDLDLGMSEDEMEKLFESGDEDAIAQALGFVEGEVIPEPKEADDFVSEEEIAALEAEEKAKAEGEESVIDGTSLGTDLKQEPSEPEGVQKVVKSKDGKHEIPYDVLENARERANKASSRATELEQNLNGTKAELEEARRLNDQLKKQLEENNLKPADVLNKADLDDETLETLSEYGDIGEIVRALALQNKQLMQGMTTGQQGAARQESQEDVDPIQQSVNAAIAANPDLSAWQTSDPDKWDMAVILDQKLRNDPNYQNATFEERFAEVARRTKAAFGLPVETAPQRETLADKASKAVTEAAKNQFPQSLTDVGRGPVQMKSRAEQFAEMSEAQLEAAFSTMTPDQIEQVMAELAY